MIPVNEGNGECWKCKHFDLGSGCIPTYMKNGLPPCGRDIIICLLYTSPSPRD